MIVVVAVAAVLAAAVVVARPWDGAPPPPDAPSPSDPRPTLGSPQRPDRIRSISVDLGLVVDPEMDWQALDARLDEAGVNGVDLSAGRVEFTGFDWEAHPEAAAEPGTDHLARAARALRTDADGNQRQIGLIVDAYVPNWIAQDPSIAGISADGERAVYTASATQLARGAVGDRLVAYVAALGERYAPSQIAVTELFLDIYSFGDDDLELFREMTGQQEWPRTADGELDLQSPVLGSWRSEVLAGLLSRMRAALDEVRDGAGAAIDLAMDVRVGWDTPATGDAVSGHEYATLLRSADRLVVWGYLFGQRAPGEIEGLTAALADAGYDMSRFEISVGLWAPFSVDPPERIPTQTLVEAVQAAGTHGITEVNVTPLSLVTDADWPALAAVWNPSG